jgi:hypothetical protein
MAERAVSDTCGTAVSAIDCRLHAGKGKVSGLHRRDILVVVRRLLAAI